MLDGGSDGMTITKNFDMTEIPVYIKAGAVVWSRSHVLKNECY
jgi:alpha-glucosidase (family GH31 glycosyl hydrolase)